MRLTDKIYIPGKWLHVPANHFETEPSPGCTEYIRKDALLEWAKEQIKAMEDFPQPYNYLHGRIAAMNDLIDKLNSM